MTHAEMKALKRGDTVRWMAEDTLGLVVLITALGPCVHWEDSGRSGPYTTEGDASRLTLVAKVVS